MHLRYAEMLSYCSLFYGNYSTLDSHTNTVISHALAFLSRLVCYKAPYKWINYYCYYYYYYYKMASKTVTRSMEAFRSKTRGRKAVCVRTDDALRFSEHFFLRKLCYQGCTRNKLLVVKAQVPKTELRCSFRVAEKNCCTLKKLLLHSFVWQILCLNSGSCIMRLVLNVFTN